MANIRITKALELKKKFDDPTKLKFGKIYTDHMFVMEYSSDKGWYDPRIEPYHAFNLDPATTVLHYAQSIFEGMKAYKTAEGETTLFRPWENFKRLNRSCARMCIPQFDEEVALSGLKELLRIEEGWIPDAPGTSLYIRPYIFATDPFLGVKASQTYIFCIILAPVGPYYAEGFNPISIYVERKLIRSAPGGTGDVKAAGNYAASLLAGSKAKEMGCAQVLWLDAIEHRYAEEVGSMNIFFKINDEVITPVLNGSILPGITRDSIIQLARNEGYTVVERPISIDEIIAAAKSGELTEVFGTGTAAVVSPVGSLTVDGGTYVINDMKPGECTLKMYELLTGIQTCAIEDDYEWVLKV